MNIEYFFLPSHWAPALINDDYSGLDEDDKEALDAFILVMTEEYGKFNCLSVEMTGEHFVKYHDATAYGVLATNCLTYAFDVTDAAYGDPTLA